MNNGRYTINHKKEDVMDVIEVVSKLSKVEVAIVQYMKDLLIDQQIFNSQNPNSNNKFKSNVVEVPTSEAFKMNDYLKKGMSKSYKHLVEVKVLIRVKRNQYMINPYFIMPSSNFDEALEMWNELTKD